VNSFAVKLHIDVHLEHLSVQELNIEVIDFVFEGELSLIVGMDTFGHGSGLRPVVVKVDGNKRDQMFMQLLFCQPFTV